MLIRCFIGLGQGGYATSFPFASLAPRVRRLGIETTVHSWNDTQTVANGLQKARKEGKKTVNLGFSLSANTLEDIGLAFGADELDLAVAYDPSRFYPRVKNGYQTAPDAYKRFLCYYNEGAWAFGGSRYEGPQVQTTTVNNFHLAVQSMESLHARTFAAIAAL